MPKRIKTNYPGVFYREAERIGGRGKEKVFYVVYKKNGKLCEEKAGRQYADDMTPARASHLRSELIEGKKVSRKEQKRQEEEQKKAEAGRYTIDRLWKEYKTSRPSGKSLKTDIGRYEKYLEAEFGDKQPQELIRSDVDRYKKRLLKKLAPQTVKHVFNLLTWIINYGVNNGLCQGPQFQIPKPSVNNQKTEDLTPEQLKRLLKALDEADDIQIANLMKLALFTGMRRGEIFKLKWEHVDLDKGFLTIKDPKGGKDAIIPINEPTRELLETQHKKRSPYVFPAKSGKMRTDIRREANKIKKAAGLPDDFRALHGLRHAFASMMASSGEVDMYTLQKLLTHKSPVMTQRYAHLRDETLKKAGKVAGEYFRSVAYDRESGASASDKG